MAEITADDVLDVLAQEGHLDRATLDPAATLENLGIASLDVISALFTFEDRFGLVIEQEDLEGVATLGQFTDVVLAKAAAKAG